MVSGNKTFSHPVVSTVLQYKHRKDTRKTLHNTGQLKRRSGNSQVGFVSKKRALDGLLMQHGPMKP